MWMLMLAALAIRLYALHLTAIINPDGSIYIQQARAIAIGQWKTGLNSVTFISLPPALISLFHLVCPDWLMAARAVSITFGTLALFPLNGLLRRFFTPLESLATTAVMTFLPTWVSNSIDVVRDPVAWLFALYGLYWLVKGVEEQKKILLPISCLSFILAAWARIEFLLYPAIFICFPIISNRSRKWTTVFLFFLPVIIALSILIIIHGHGKSIFLQASRLQDGIAAITNGIPQYAELRKSLSILSHQQNFQLSCFLDEARSFVWLIGMATIANRLFEAMSYPVTTIAVFSIGAFLRRNNSSNRDLAIFLTLLSASAIGILYARTLQQWVIEYRYMMLAIIPAALFLAAGISSLAKRINKTGWLTEKNSLLLLTGLLIISTIPKNIEARGISEVALMQIGKFLDQNTSPNQEVTIAASEQTIRIVHFYANITRPGAPFPKLPDDTYSSLVGASVNDLVVNLQRRHIEYLLWEENNRPPGWPSKLNNDKLIEINRWHNHQTGAIIVYKVKSDDGNSRTTDDQSPPSLPQEATLPGNG